MDAISTIEVYLRFSRVAAAAPRCLRRAQRRYHSTPACGSLSRMKMSRGRFSQNNSSFLSRTGVRLGFALVLTLSCSGRNASQGPQASVELKPCRLGAISKEVRCTIVDRPRDPKEPAAGSFPLAVTVIPGRGKVEPGTPPLFLLAGGPGQGARKAFGGQKGLIKAWNLGRDIVLVDIRGTGDSDAVECDAEEKYQKDISIDSQTRLEVLRLKKCRERMGPRKPEHYYTPLIADDLNAVREALGYSQISLYGGSYGTRLALEFARRHDAHTHRVVLDGVAPVSMALPWKVAQTFERAWSKISDYCEADPACKARFPEVRSSLRRLIDKVRSEEGRTYRIDSPSRDLHQRFRPEAKNIAQLFTAPSYSPILWALMPLAIDKAIQGDWRTIMGALDQEDSGINLMVLYSIVCNEDRRVWPSQEPGPEILHTALGSVQIDSAKLICPHFKGKALPPEYYEPIQSSKPVLLLSGDADPVTPPSYAKEVQKHLPNSLEITVPFTGHNTVFTDCVQGVVHSFLKADEPLNVDHECVASTPRPFFFTNLNGPSLDFKAAQEVATQAQDTPVHP